MLVLEFKDLNGRILQKLGFFRDALGDDLQGFCIPPLGLSIGFGFQGFQGF